MLLFECLMKINYRILLTDCKMSRHLYFLKIDCICCYCSYIKNSIVLVVIFYWLIKGSALKLPDIFTVYVSKSI
jgi:hypothetical protein